MVFKILSSITQQHIDRLTIRVAMAGDIIFNDMAFFFFFFSSPDSKCPVCY